MDNYEFCIINNEKDILEYEKGLYTAFKKHDPDGWYINNYNIINENRMQSEISYNFQIIYALKKENRIIGAGAYTFANIEKFQLNKMNFKILPEDKNKKIIEGINMFALEQVKGENFIKILVNFTDFMLEDLKIKKFNVLYGTCSDKIKPIYLILGYDFIDKKVVNGEKRNLFKYNLNEG